LLNGEKPSANRKRPHTGPEEDYEQLPRKLFAGESNQNVKALLPTIINQKLKVISDKKHTSSL
jgi:hypothetical protein